MNLDEEAERATELLRGKIVAHVARHRAEEICLEFTDGTRLYVDKSADGVDLSITGGGEDPEITPGTERLGTQRIVDKQ